MNIKKLAPWNWFKSEEDSSSVVPVERKDRNRNVQESDIDNPIVQLRHNIDRLFEHAFRDFGLVDAGADLLYPLADSNWLKPRVDIGATEKEYTITVEVPGVNKEDVSVEVENNILTIHGEKKREKEEKSQNFYSTERTYGSFRRVLNLPADADDENINSSFKKGVLTVKMPRIETQESKIKRIEIKSEE